MYEANVDDVGYRLVAIYTPVRDDGVEGQPVSASTDPIAVGITFCSCSTLLTTTTTRIQILTPLFSRVVFHFYKVL